MKHKRRVVEIIGKVSCLITQTSKSDKKQVKDKLIIGEYKIINKEKKMIKT